MWGRKAVRIQELERELHRNKKSFTEDKGRIEKQRDDAYKRLEEMDQALAEVAALREWAEIPEVKPVLDPDTQDTLGWIVRDGDNWRTSFDDEDLDPAVQVYRVARKRVAEERAHRHELALLEARRKRSLGGLFPWDY